MTFPLEVAHQAPGPPAMLAVMAAAETRFQTPLPTWTLLKSVDSRALTAVGILTFPEFDHDDDYVHPGGGVWNTPPYVNVEHVPPMIGRGTVELKSLPDVGTVPLGTTHFDPNSRASMQAFKLVADGVLPGLSLEYKPIGPLNGPHWKSLGYPSSRLPRDAMEFLRWQGLGWALCARPVQPNALQLLPEYEKAVRIVEAGQLDGSPLDPVIFKSLSAVAARITRPASVRGIWDKGMGGGIYADAPGYPGGEQGEEQHGELPAGPTPAVRAYKNLAQGILDLIERFESDMDMSEHTGALARMDQDVERIQQFAEELNGFGDDVADDVAGKMKKPGEAEPSEEDELDDETDRADVAIDEAEPVEEEEAEEAPPKKPGKKKPPFGKSLLVDASGGIITKAYPGYVPDRVRRYRASEFVPVAAAEVPADPDQQAAEAELAREMRLAQKSRKNARPYIDLIESH